MCNLHGTPFQEYAHLSFIRLISNAHNINFGALNKPLFHSQTVTYFHLEAACSSSFHAVSRVVKGHTAQGILLQGKYGVLM